MITQLKRTSSQLPTGVNLLKVLPFAYFHSSGERKKKTLQPLKQTGAQCYSASEAENECGVDVTEEPLRNPKHSSAPFQDPTEECT